MISAKCGGCAKVYKVEERLAGKRVKCKACGETFSIPKVMAGVPLGAGKPVARASVSKPAMSKPAAVAAPAVEDDPFNNIDALMSLEQGGTIDDAPPVAMTPPTYAPAPSQRRGPIVEYVNADGTTSNRPPAALSYATPVAKAQSAATLLLIDKIIPGILIGIGWGLPLALSLVGFFLTPNKGRAFFSIVINQGLTFGVVIPIILIGVTYAANNSRFDLTENPRYKILAILCSFGITGLILVLLLASGMMSAGLSGINGRNIVQMGMMLLGLGTLVCLAVGYFLFKLFFHCSWMQALVGFLMFFLFTILAGIACFAILFVLGLILGPMLAAGGPP